MTNASSESRPFPESDHAPPRSWSLASMTRTGLKMEDKPRPTSVVHLGIEWHGNAALLIDSRIQRGGFSRHGLLRPVILHFGTALIHLTLPGKTDSGTAGTQPGEGYSGRYRASGAVDGRQVYACRASVFRSLDAGDHASKIQHPGGLPLNSEKNPCLKATSDRE